MVGIWYISVLEKGNDLGYRILKTVLSRHHITLLKYLLPLLSLGLFGCVCLWPSPTLQPQFVDKKIALAANEAKILRFSSVDKQHRPFVILSQTGQQISEQEIFLQHLEVTLRLENGEQIQMRGDKGIYNQSNRKMELTGWVHLKHSNGVELTTTAATIDFDKGTAENNLPVEGRNHHAKIKAKGFKILEQGQRIVFLGHPEFTAHR